MIKQIQLRGISRTPSDRMNEDGGVAESLNTYIAEGESAPALPPEDMAAKLGLPTKNSSVGSTSITQRCVYIHKMGSNQRFIYVLNSQNGSNYVEYLYDMQTQEAIYSGSNGEKIIDATVTSIGNTLIFSTTKCNGYALYKSGGYTYLGSELPQPQLAVYPKLYTGSKATFVTSVDVYPDNINSPSQNEEYKEDSLLYSAIPSQWEKEIAKEEGKRSAAYNKILSAFWDGIQGALFGSPYFKYPVAVRFALKLYDGSYVHHTVPIFLGGGAKRFFDAKMVYTKYQKTISSARPDGSLTTVTRYKTYVNATGTRNAYKFVSKLGNADDFQNWKDIIQSIDMFITPPILYPKINSDLVECGEPTLNEPTEELFTYTLPFIFQDKAGSDEENEGVKDAILNGTRLFYKVRSFPIDNLSALSEGYEQKNSKQLSYTENLYTHEVLPDDYRSNSVYIPEINYTINRRLVSIGMTEFFGRGMEALYGLTYTTALGSSVWRADKKYSFFYEILDNDGLVKCVKSRSSYKIPSLSWKNINYSTEGYYASDVAQILFYPDTRCQAVNVIDANGNIVRLEMKAHPYLNCAYYIGDVSKTLGDLAFASGSTLVESRQGSTYGDDYLFQSALENPFYYPVSGRIKLSASLVAVASISTALSEGQYGQFDLYAFTDNGIWALTPNDEGVYTRFNPLSRDVCISSSAAVCLDQAVVFITKRGVMLLDGSKITCLSPNMNGEHYVMEDAAITVLNKVDPDLEYDFALRDGNPFMKFMTDNSAGGTQIAYDYTGSRLIFFNPHYHYQYVYMLQTNTWHKSLMPLQKNDVSIYDIKILNSYPDCYMFCRDEESGLHLYNWSTVLDVSDKTTEVASVIATRPFDLGETDVLKTINHLKIRGHYERYRTLADGTKKPRVSYMLFGSQDGFNFYRLGSLRGKSWKLFRLIILSYLRPTERISYIDIDYETRFTNKLR